MSQLAPSPKFAATYVNGSGAIVPAVGYKLYAYTAGTTTPKDTYTDYTLGSANTNPVVLNARGECDLWLSGNYKLVLKTDADVTVWTVDEVRDLTNSQTLTNMTLAGTLTVTSTAVTWSGNPTHSGNHTWSGNQTFNGNVTVGDSSVDTLTVKPNTVTWTNNPTHSGNHTWSGTQTFNGSTTIGDATADTATVNATTTFPLAVTTHTFGAKFGNTDRADSSTLDHYLEGTWTPGLSFGGATTGWTFGVFGMYTRIGRLIICSYSISVTAKGSATGNCLLTGLPVASNSTDTSIIAMGGGVTQFTSMLTNQIYVSARIDTTAGVTTAKVYGAAAAAASSVQLTDAAFQVGSNISGTFIYFT